MEHGLDRPGTDPRTELALAGKALYGDDFSQEEIDAWFRSEQEGYFNLYYAPGGMNGPVGAEVRAGGYVFAAVVDKHLFSRLKEKTFNSVLGIGSGDGQELRPLLKRTNSITILEPSDGFATSEIDGVPVRYIKPQASGIMPFADQTFDLITCFQALHHIPNVSTVVREMYRTQKPGGHTLLMEPTNSMGDWRYPRVGLTKNERGIPPAIFREIISQAGFTIEYQTNCMFSLMSRFQRIGIAPWQSPWIVRLDEMVCRFPIWPSRYHPRAWWHKLRPTGTTFMLLKDR
jgi:SAM-dependent methyltransferase